MEKVGFVGLSHLGIVASNCWDDKFGNVVAMDTNEDLVSKLNHGELPIREPKLKISGSIKFTTDFRDLSKCDIVFISIDIETDNDNVGRYGKFYELVRGSIPYLKDGVIMVIMSQVNVGTCENVKRIIKEALPELKFDLVYMVETLVIGDAVDRFMNPERIILGMGDDVPLLMRYLSKFRCPIITMGYRSAELTKMSINFFLYNSVTFANTLSDICEKVGADINEIISALRLDKRIGKYAYIQPSLGIAGGNLERDMESLRGSDDSGFVYTLIEKNNERYKWIVDVVESCDNVESICIWGLGYKKGMISMKNSLAPKIITELDYSYHVATYDPLIQTEYHNMYDALRRGSDCLIILNDSDEFKNADIGLIKEIMTEPLIIDCCNVLKERKDELEGVKYIAIGVGK